MFRNHLHAVVTGAWVTIIAVAYVAGLTLGTTVSLQGGLMWLMAGVVPPFLFAPLFQGAPPKTVAQVLYETELEGPAAPRT